jgi:tetratricopeptide (TPR) repeat protein
LAPIVFLPAIIFEIFIRVKCHWIWSFWKKTGRWGVFHSLFHLLYFKGAIGFPFCSHLAKWDPFTTARETIMAEISNRTKRLVGELAVLICIFCVWCVKSSTFDTADVKAAVLKQVVKVDSDDLDAYRFLAGYYMDSGRYEEAAGALRQVVRMDPNDSAAQTMLGDAYWNCGCYEKAMMAYKQAMKMQLDNPYIHYQVGQAYLKMGDKDSALEEYEALKDMDKELANQLLVLIHK